MFWLQDNAIWRSFYCNGAQKAYEAEAHEYDEEFTDAPSKDTEVKEYNTLYHAARATLAADVKEKLFPITASQSYCITRILKSIRPLHYSTALGAKAFRESERKRVQKEKEEAEAVSKPWLLHMWCQLPVEPVLTYRGKTSLVS